MRRGRPPVADDVVRRVAGPGTREPRGPKPVLRVAPRDHDHPERSHVIPAPIRKCLDAVIVCWGDGSPTREFLYVEDCAEAIVLATERYDKPEPVRRFPRAEWVGRP